MKKLIRSLITTAAIALAITPSAYSAEVNIEDSQTVSQASLVNINTATAQQLENLPGIGPKKARAIVDYRTENGRFLSINELTGVKGIGKKMVEKLSNKVSTG
jgi:competence protein ComEA